MEKWKGKVAVVTGGSSGMGAAVAKKLLEHDLIVIILDINPSNGEGFHFFKCNVSSVDAIKEAFKWIEEKFSYVHILINCAGICRAGDVLNDSDETTNYINDVIAINFSGVVHIARAAYQLMKKSNDYGFIVNFASILSHVIPFPNQISIYPATKFAVRAFTETLRQELIVNGDEKIRVSNLSPGLVATNILSHSTMSQEMLATSLEKCPNSLQPDDVANSILFLLSTPYHVNITELTIRPIGEKY